MDHYHHHHQGNNKEEKEEKGAPSLLVPPTSTRATFFRSCVGIIALSFPGSSHVAHAAPPIAIISEELGYFPVRNQNGNVTYVPARVRRTSTDQSIELASHLRKTGAVMYGAFWCPHCQNQREIFGREAWSLVRYVECTANGLDSKASTCQKEGIDGFPTWKFRGGKTASGEMSLVELANLSGYTGDFRTELEPSMPTTARSCK